MKTCLDCIPCFLRGAVDISKRLSLSDADAETLLRETLALISELDWALPPPMLARRIQAALRSITRNSDPYRRQKITDTETALRLLPRMEAAVAASRDPFLTAVRFAIAGNAIDLGARPQAEVDIQQTVDQALTHPVDEAAVSRLESMVSSAERILFLADNAGEIVFDRPLLTLIGSEKVTVAVRGAPTINDATLDDAERSGITDRFTVVSNGSDAPGTCLDDCSTAFVSRFNRADLIISKGQGNFECLNRENRAIAFLFLVKCPLVADQTGLPVHTFAIRINTP